MTQLDTIVAHLIYLRNYHHISPYYSLVENSRKEVRERAVQLLTPLIDQLVTSSLSHDGGRVLLNALKTYTHHKQ